MAKRFGEEVSDDDAYTTAREALKHIKDPSRMDALADTPIKKQALADERAARS